MSLVEVYLPVMQNREKKAYYCASITAQTKVWVCFEAIVTGDIFVHSEWSGWLKSQAWTDFNIRNTE